MKIKTLISGFTGEKHYEPGTELSGDGDHVRGLLANALALPMDAEAENFVEKVAKDKSLLERYSRPGLAALRKEVAVLSKELAKAEKAEKE